MVCSQIRHTCITHLLFLPPIFSPLVLVLHFSTTHPKPCGLTSSTAMSTDQASSSPLQDHTNQPAAEAAPDLVTLQGEIVHLKSLVDRFNSRHGRGRKKGAWCVLLCYCHKAKALTNFRSNDNTSFTPKTRSEPRWLARTILHTARPLAASLGAILFWAMLSSMAFTWIQLYWEMRESPSKIFCQLQNLLTKFFHLVHDLRRAGRYSAESSPVSIGTCSNFPRS
jgi:hypothetical protein